MIVVCANLNGVPYGHGVFVSGFLFAFNGVSKPETVIRCFLGPGLVFEYLFGFARSLQDLRNEFER